MGVPDARACLARKVLSVGLSIDKETFSQVDYGLFAERLQQSLVVLRDLLDRPGFGDGPKTLGAEMELSIVDQEGCAYPINRSVLAGNLDPSFQLELDRFNLELQYFPGSLGRNSLQSNVGGHSDTDSTRLYGGSVATPDVGSPGKILAASAGGRRLAGPVSGKIGPGLSRWRMDGAQLSQATAGEWADPKARDVGTTVEEFLTRLGGPTWIVLSGRDPLRTRAVTTLLHGNEPSGVRAIFQWLRSGTRPRVNLACFIGAVEAALAQPGFAYRHLPECRDLNRCFRMPFEGREGRMAAGVLDRLRAINPEALMDFHNTSGRSPAYGVTTRLGEPQKALTALFSHHLIVTDLRLGTLMEATEEDFPTITAECGGGGDARSDQTAMTALRSYAMAETLWDAPHRYAHVKTFHHPIRVSLEAGKQVAYGASSMPDADLTLRKDADQFNFGVLNQGETLGWVRDASLSVVAARDAKGRDRTREMFAVVDGRLVVQPSRILMMTTNPQIAVSDCLFYCLPVSSSEL